MRHDELRSVIPGVIDLAREAGHAIIEIYDRHKTDVSEIPSALVTQKADQSPLTLADLASHQVIGAGLRKLTPGIPVVSEEDSESLVYRVGSGDFWLVDPLDGTKEFLARNGEFTVNIALIRDGEPVWGVVFAPVLDLMYWGGMGQGAFREDGGMVEAIHVSAAVSAGGRYRVVASKSHLNEETSNFIVRLGPADLVQAGSSLKFCRIAEGAADVYPRLAPTCEWDTAAAQAVVEGAGGLVTDLAGVRLRYGKPELLNPHFVASSIPLATLGLTS
jgi:3'(2'), 5'-bisphosphate nucleotidase